MTSKKLFAASLALFAMQAHGMTLDAHGVGQVLIYPYYTVNNHQQTLFSVDNGTENGKAFQVTFREAYDGRVVYAQDVFVGANQTWSANVFALRDIGVASDGVGIASVDRACTQTLTNLATATMPSGLTYHTFDASSFTGAHADGGPTTDARLREGFFEVIELGQIAGGTAVVISPRETPTLDCSAVVPSIKMIGDLGTPSGGLSGSSAVLNVAQGTFYGLEPTAIDGFRAQRIVPPMFADLGMAGYDGDDTVRASVPYRGDFITATFPKRQAIDAVSALFMATTLSGDIDNTNAIGAATDWVLTFPTKQFYVDKTPAVSNTLPFDKRFGDTPSGSSPVHVGYSAFSRDGYDETGNWCEFLECPPVVPAIGYQTQVVAFDPKPETSSAVLGSSLGTPASIAPNTVGTAHLVFDGRLNKSAEGNVLDGLPVIGVQAIHYVNGNVAAGVLANYRGSVPLRTTLDCEAAAGCR